MTTTMTTQPRVSVCLATYNKAPVLAKVLASIFAQSPPFSMEVIVADDGSSDDTARVVQDAGADYIRLDENRKYRNPAGPRNAAYAQAKGDIVIAQSDDVVHAAPHQAVIERLVCHLEQTPNSVIVASVINIKSDGSKAQTYTSARLKKPFLFLGAIWRADILAIGGCDEDFEAPAYEDQWFADCLMHGLGRQFVFVDDVVGHHQDHRRPARLHRTPSYHVHRRKTEAAQADPTLWRAWKTRLLAP
jgi:succinoglycan biosynthesis protein ExoO